MECDAATHLCREYPSLGMPCTGGCRGESFCASTTGLCAAPQVNGSACGSHYDCISFFCQEGSVFSKCADPPACF